MIEGFKRAPDFRFKVQGSKEFPFPLHEGHVSLQEQIKAHFVKLERGTCYI